VGNIDSDNRCKTLTEGPELGDPPRPTIVMQPAGPSTYRRTTGGEQWGTQQMFTPTQGQEVGDTPSTYHFEAASRSKHLQKN
jgi:hypothetical protein